MALRPREGGGSSAILAFVYCAARMGCVLSLGIPCTSPLRPQPQVVLQKFDAHTSTTVQQSAELLRHWQVAESFLVNIPQFLSLASDKSRVLGKSLQVTALLTPDNIGIWTFPVVRLQLFSLWTGVWLRSVRHKP